MFPLYSVLNSYNPSFINETNFADTLPAEGFDNQVVDEVLELDKYGLKSVSLMYVGYANPEKDWLAPMKKVRIPKEEFILRF